MIRLLDSIDSKSATQAQPTPRTADRLFDTAAALFWEKGYAATTTREIAAAVGVQQASLYHHIESKEELLYQICLSSLQQFLSEVQSALNVVDNPLDRLRTLIDTHVTTLLRYQTRNVTMLTELRALSRPHHNEIVALREKYAGFVRSTLRHGQGAGMIRTDIAAEYLCLALLNMLNWSALWFRKDQALTAEQLAELFITIYLNGAASSPARRSLKLPDIGLSVKTPVFRTRKLKTSKNSTLERLLDAAVALFSRKGYAATSTREVAGLLGIQKASLFYHVESKEDLLYFICKSSLEQIRSDVETAIQEIQDPLERTRVLICTHIESMLRDQDKHSTTLAEMHALSHGRLAEVLSLRDAYEDFVRSTLQAAQRAGSLREEIDVKYLCLSLLGLMNRVLVWYRSGGPLSPAQIGQLFAVIFLTGIALL